MVDDSAVSEARAEGALVLKGQRSTFGATSTRCPGVGDLFVVTPAGRRYPLPCGRRDCRPCQKWRDDILARVLLYDAAFGVAPTVAATLTTKDPDTPARLFRHAMQMATRDLRRQFDGFEYAGMIEFTTGKTKQSGGHRRIHSHNVCKGVTADDVLAIEQVFLHHWRRLLSATVVEVAALHSTGGAIGYFGIHHRKPEQQPPKEWRGMTLRWSKGYLGEPVAVARARAGDELAIERIEWAVRQELADDDEVAREVGARLEARDEQLAGVWRIEHGRVTPFGLYVPCGPLERPFDWSKLKPEESDTLAPKPAGLAARVAAAPADAPPTAGRADLTRWPPGRGSSTSGHSVPAG